MPVDSCLRAGRDLAERAVRAEAVWPPFRTGDSFDVIIRAVPRYRNGSPALRDVHVESPGFALAAGDASVRCPGDPGAGGLDCVGFGVSGGGAVGG